MMKSNLFLAGLLVFGASLANAAEPYHFLKEIPINGEGGWDYLSVDSKAQRLYMSHGTVVVVVDLARDVVVGEITNTPGVHGLAVAPELGKGFVSCGRENKAAIVDLKTLQTISKVGTGENPDGMLYEPGQKEAYMFNGHSQSATVIDAVSGKVVATISLAGKPEFPAAEPASHRVFDNIEDQSEVAVINTSTHTVTTNWPVAPGEEPSGMAIDPENHRLFLGCHNNLMIMMNSENGKIAGSVPIGGGVDATAFDPGTKFAFASCGDGTTTIAREDSPDQLTTVQTLKTKRGARTMALDPATHKIYLPSAEYEAPKEGAPSGGGRRRPKMIPGTLKLLVFGM